MLDVRNLNVSYGMHRALHDINLNVKASEIVVILGANGAGKSSLLRAIGGLCEGKVAGSITLNGERLIGLAPDVIVEKGISFVPEGRGIFADLTVSENLVLGAYPKRARHKEEANLGKVFALFPKLAERKSQTVRTMSGGEQQMVAIGRAMMASPDILMLDEPSLGLSPLLCKELFQTLAHIRGTGMGVLLVEQNAKQSLAIADRGYLIENGELVGENDAAALLNDPAVQKAYLGAGAMPAHSPSALRPPQPAARRRPSDRVTEKAFISASPTSVVQQSSDRLAGEAIQSLVARASDAAHAATEARGVAKVQPQTTTSHHQHSPAPNVSTLPTAQPDPTLSSRDPEVAKLIAEMEAAAASARTTGQAARRPANKQPFDAPEDLPEIAVYRRSKVEVYRRDPDGRLARVKET